MIKVTESEHYIICKEFETVILLGKRSRKIIAIIGDFYGEVEKAVISPDEKYCAMAGCGIILYYLRAPFTSYAYGKKTVQWKEWWRNGDVWIEDIALQNNILIAWTETGEERRISLDSHPWRHLKFMQ